MTLTVALTGATGFVGKTLLPLLLAKGHDVRVLVRDPARLVNATKAKVIKGGLSDNSALFELTSGADVVLHVAGAIKALGRDEFFRVNVEGTKAVAKATAAGGAKRFIFVSSLAARRPEISAYAASKRTAEDWLRTDKHGLDTLILRPAAIYGEGDEATFPLIAGLMSRFALLPGQSSARFSLVHVEDFARVCTDAVTSVETGLLEVDDDAGGYLWSDLAEVTRSHFGRPSLRSHIPRSIAMLLGHGGDLWSRLSGKPAMLSADKMREFYQPGWVTEGKGWPRKTAISLEDGLVRTIAWYQSQGWLPRNDTGDTSHREKKRQTP